MHFRRLTSFTALLLVLGYCCCNGSHVIEREILANRRAAQQQQQRTQQQQQQLGFNASSPHVHGPVFVAMLIFTAPGRRAHRDAVAETWGGDAGRFLVYYTITNPTPFATITSSLA